MKDIAQEFSQLRTAALASGKITAAQIIEATKGLDTVEMRYSALLKLTESHNITVPVAETASDKIAKLTEKIVASGKVTAVQINESMNGCANEAERFDALQSLAVAKQIGTKQIVRNNGGRIAESSVDLTESDRTNQRVKQYAKKFKVSEKEACAMLGLPYLTESVQALKESTGDANTTRLSKQMFRLRKLGFSEADAKKVIEQGLC